MSNQIISIKQQINSLTTRPDNKKYWTETKLNSAIQQLNNFKFVDLREHLGRSYKSYLPKLFLFLSKLRNRAYNDYQPFPIITTSANWLKLDNRTMKQLGIQFGDKIQFSWLYTQGGLIKQKTETYGTLELFSINNVMDVCRLIKACEKLGILAKVCNRSYIGENTQMAAKSHSCYYICNKSRLINTLTLIYDTISIHILHNHYIFNLDNVSNQYVIPITNKLGGNKYECDIDKMNYMNTYLPEEEIMAFDGKRAWSPLCTFEKSRRDDYLLRRFGKKYWEWDRTACIPNLIYSLNTGKFNDNDKVDLHSLLAGKKLTGQERDNFKTLNMLKWFGDGRSVLGIINSAEKKCKSGKGTIKASQRNILNALVEITHADEHGSWKLFREQALNYYKEMRNRAEEILGPMKKWKDSIFIHESNIHIRFVYALREMGCDVAEVYDGFYFGKGDRRISNKALNKLYKQIVLDYVKEINNKQ